MLKRGLKTYKYSLSECKPSMGLCTEGEPCMGRKITVSGRFGRLRQYQADETWGEEDLYKEIKVNRERNMRKMQFQLKITH